MMIFSCDVNSANLYFLEKQNKITLHNSGGFNFRHYKGSGENRDGWLLPEQAELKPYIQQLLTIEAAPNFILLTEEQKTALQICIDQFFTNYKIAFNSNPGDSDYVYEVEKMALLPGKDFQKKRNHVSRFNRTYGADWHFEFFTAGAGTFSNPAALCPAGAENTSDKLGVSAALSGENTFNGSAAFNDSTALPRLKLEQKLAHIKQVYGQWQNSRPSTQDDFLLAEQKSIDLLTDAGTFEKLKFSAGILYVKNQPVAFAAASFTAPECLNIHFEKCLEDAGENGAPAVLNQELAKAVLRNYPGCKYLNREEDLNVPGLRKSKLSYKPAFLIEKYYGKMELAGGANE